MQTYEGADEELSYRVTGNGHYNGDRLYAYCCSSSNTFAFAEGASRR